MTIKTTYWNLILCFFISCFCQKNIFCQTPVIEWQKCYGGQWDDIGSCIQQTSDGGYIMAGETRSNNGDVSGNHGGEYDFWIVKINSIGDLEWQKCFGGSGIETAACIQQTIDGGYIVVGITDSNSGDVTGYHGINADWVLDYWVIKISSVGNLEWQKCFGGTGEDWARSIQQTNDGGYIVAGYTNSTDGDVTGNHGEYDYWVVKISSAGNLEWQKCFGGTGQDRAYSIATTNDGGYVVAGYTESMDGDVTENNGSSDYWIIKLNSSGNLEWQKSYGSTVGEVARSICQTSDGGYIINGENGQFWVVKIDSFGSIEWQKSLGSNNGLDIKQTMDGGYIATGFTTGNSGDVWGNHGSYDYWVVKLNAAGDFEWQKCLGGSHLDSGSSILQTIDGGYIVLGHAISTNGDVTGNHGSRDFWVVKLENCFATSTNTISPVACHEYTSPGGHYWTNSGVYTDILTNAAGCDSIITINLTVVSPLVTLSVITCDENYTSPSGKIWTTTGLYYDTIVNPNNPGCGDTIYKIYLTNNHLEASVELNQWYIYCSNNDSPDTYQWMENNNTLIPGATGPVYEAQVTGSYAVIITKNGCTDTSAYYNYVFTCGEDYISPSGKIWTATGLYYDTVPNPDNPGYDDSLYIFYIVNRHIEATAVLYSDFVYCNSIPAGTVAYQWLDCENNYAIIPGETNVDFFPPQPGTYAAIATKSGCTDTSQCIYFINTVGIDKLQHEKLQIYPNPTVNKKFTIESEAKIQIIELSDLSGRILPIQINYEFGTVDCSNLVSGNFFVRVTTEMGVLMEKIMILD